MKQGIIISTWAGWTEPLQTLLTSLRDYHKYPIYIVINDAYNVDPDWLQFLGKTNNIFLNYDDGYELGALKIVYDNTDLDEMVLLQDTIEVLDPSVFEGIFTLYGDKCLSYGTFFTCYLGKYTRKALDRVTIPVIRNKDDSLYWEHAFAGMLFRTEDIIYIFDANFEDLNPNNYYDDKFGRTNLVLTSKWLIKRKASVGPPMDQDTLDEQPELVNTALAVFTPIIVEIKLTGSGYAYQLTQELLPIADRIVLIDENDTSIIVSQKNEIKDRWNPWVLTMDDTEFIPSRTLLNMRRFCDWPALSRPHDIAHMNIQEKDEIHMEPRFKRVRNDPNRLPVLTVPEWIIYKRGDDRANSG